MAHSYIEFHGKRVLINDLDILLAISLIMCQQNKVPSSIHTPDEIKKLFGDWKALAFTAGAGCIDLNLDVFLIHESSVQFLLHLIQNALNDIQNFGDSLPADFMRSVLENKVQVLGDSKVVRVMEVLHKFRDVLN